MSRGKPITTDNIEEIITPIITSITTKIVTEVVAEATTQILNVMEKRFDQVDRRFERLERRLDEAWVYIDDHEGRLRTLESKPAWRSQL
ncbi:MAG TPA: hypothetical protein VGO07_05790 [Candidatus Saccharimonadales bacterium]|jgi:hypothetical protein|nr:hypothetical protein [Candidatus Saccharimonadales bacterium]